MPKFKITLGEETEVVDAPNSLEAWASFCDARKKWPPPKTATVEEYTPAMAKADAAAKEQAAEEAIARTEAADAAAKEQAAEEAIERTEAADAANAKAAEGPSAHDSSKAKPKGK
jgi:hypothetical protein